ncbi:MAG: hypothetical protein V3T72_15095 [Thermoanaerobaculia bacterium]
MRPHRRGSRAVSISVRRRVRCSSAGLAATLFGLWILSLAACAPVASQEEQGARLPAGGAGEPAPEPAKPAAPDLQVAVFLHLVLRVHAGGEIEPVSVTRMPGQPVISPIVKSDYLLEVRLDGRTLSVESPPDPFDAHSFGDPQGAGHHRQRLAAAELAVKVPATDFTSEHLDRLTIRLLAIEPGADLSTIDAATFSEVEARGLLKTVAETDEALAAWIRDRDDRRPPR